MKSETTNPRAEKDRLDATAAGREPWKKWGPYLSERQWGTVREDYSSDGNAWNYFTHDQARSRAYHWGEDGLAGISDDHQKLCFALALWNGRDPIVKERLFGLANAEGNHGEDVKEYYFYLDSTPTHSYMKYLYKYPQAAYPYEDLIKTNRSRGQNELEYELLDTGVFNDDRYFDVFVEYAKGAPEDILIRITVHNRGKERADLQVLPTLWFRNTWSWGDGGKKPQLKATKAGTLPAIQAHHDDLGDYLLICDSDVELLFTENESNNQRLWGQPNPSPFVKDAFNEFVVHGNAGAVNPDRTGTKAAARYKLSIGGGESRSITLRLVPQSQAGTLGKANEVFAARLGEADAFYASITPPEVAKDEDRSRVFRQALAGMLWSKQFFYYDMQKWLEEHGAGLDAPLEARKRMRNGEWFHMVNEDIISMPDKWEYPWYAAWDLAFHTIALGTVDTDFALDQLDLMLRNHYQHPNGQIPAYEWNFSDVNPPVHAWAAMQLYLKDKARKNGKGDIEFLKYAFAKLLVNFTWWVNRKDRTGANVFEGGFLGLDNIGVFDRSSPLPTGGYLEQADGTAWMVFFSQQMLRIAVELALHDHIYEEFVQRFFGHTVFIARAMDRVGENHDEMWDETDGFFYDVLRLPDGSATRLRVRSMVGLLPLAAVVVFEEDILAKLPRVREGLAPFIKHRDEVFHGMHTPDIPGVAGRRMISILNESKLRRILTRMLDENEFFGPYGIRALSRYHRDNPFIFNVAGQEYRVGYWPGDSESGMFGGNSNWRGPVWMPVNFLLLNALLRLYSYYGDNFKIECPTGSGKVTNLLGVARELSERLIRTFTRGADGKRPVYGGSEKFQNDPHWRDLILFYEYFHGDNGAGIGASHQTGWTGTVARIIQMMPMMTPDLLKAGAEDALLNRLMADEPEKVIA
jgi:mannosylglycerate hydrolase MGH1-like protein